MRTAYKFLLLLLLVLMSCSQDYPNKNQPIGIFDSGTGGLTVLEALLASHHFDKESFIYLADQANMPYGNYSSEGKTAFLEELVLNDAAFLMEHKSKILVIACNTATAYGLDNVEEMLQASGTGVQVVGVIDAGVKAVLDQISPSDSAAIGVLATIGTIDSDGYQQTIRRIAEERGYTGRLQVVAHGSLGFAEAVDGEPDFVNPALTVPRDAYRGPSLTHPTHPIDLSLLPAYNFASQNHKILLSGNPTHPDVLQLNAAENFARYHLLSLVEQLRKSENPLLLTYLILGCTHYPYYKDVISKHLQELREYCVDGVYIYRHIIAENVNIIDPAVETAEEVYERLQASNLLRPRPADPSKKNAFYISVPKIDSLDKCNLDENGRFTYTYKFSRNHGQHIQDVNRVPFANSNVDEATRERLHASLPYVWPLLPFAQ